MPCEVCAALDVDGDGDVSHSPSLAIQPKVHRGVGVEFTVRTPSV